MRTTGRTLRITERLSLETRGDDDIRDLTPDVQALVDRHHLHHGQVLVFVPGSTAAVTTIEFEPGLRRDLPAALERLAPRALRYQHEDTWHDGNGHSHVRASLLGPSLVVPVADGKLLLGTWQQVILVDCDNRPRQREVVVQLSGDAADGKD
jgi:secondary thiamine-phosphate synthase enzyme